MTGSCSATCSTRTTFPAAPRSGAGPGCSRLFGASRRGRRQRSSSHTSTGSSGPPRAGGDPRTGRGRRRRDHRRRRWPRPRRHRRPLALLDHAPHGRRVPPRGDRGADRRGEARGRRPRRRPVPEPAARVPSRHERTPGAAGAGAGGRGGVQAPRRGGDGDGSTRIPARARDRPQFHGTQSLLASRIVLGELHFGEIVNESSHPPIIDTDTWSKVQRMRSPRGRHAKSERLLARLGVLRCATCGSRMVIGSTDQNGKRHYFYRCPPIGDCPAASPSAPSLPNRP